MKLFKKIITINVVARSIFNQASYIKCIIREVMPNNCNFSLIIFEHVQLHLPFWVLHKSARERDAFSKSACSSYPAQKHILVQLYKGWICFCLCLHDLRSTMSQLTTSKVAKSNLFWATFSDAIPLFLGAPSPRLS